MRNILTTGIVCMLLPCLAYAKNVSSPYVDEGVVELETKHRFDNDHRASEDNYRRHELGIAYGVNEWLGLGYTAEYERTASGKHQLNNSSVEANLQLTPTGAYWLDVGGRLGYNYAHKTGDADEIEARILLAKHYKQFRHLMNFNYSQEIGSDRSRKPEGEIRWATRYNHNKSINPGLEYYADFGEISNTGAFDDQKHHVGFALYGRLPYSFAYETGWLVGVSDAAEDNIFKLNFKYEFAY